MEKLSPLFANGLVLKVSRFVCSELNMSFHLEIFLPLFLHQEIYLSVLYFFPNFPFLPYKPTVQGEMYQLHYFFEIVFCISSPMKSASPTPDRCVNTHACRGSMRPAAIVRVKLWIATASGYSAAPNVRLTPLLGFDHLGVTLPI